MVLRFERKQNYKEDQKLIHDCFVFLQVSTIELKADATMIENADRAAATNVITDMYSV